MGNESSRSGIFAVRPGISRADAIEALEETGIFQFSNSYEQVKISFTGAIYHMEKELEIVRKYFNGEFGVTEDEAEDIWTLVFLNGKIFQRKGKIVYGDPEELERIDAIWK